MNLHGGTIYISWFLFIVISYLCGFAEIVKENHK
jgi:hypothetical protein